MTPKRHAPAKDSSSKPKRKRKTMTISEKVKLLDILKEGRSFVVVARRYGVNESTVRYIKKDEANSRKTAVITVSTEAKRVLWSYVLVQRHFAAKEKATTTITYHHVFLQGRHPSYTASTSIRRVSE